jgi:hypothetical protein
MFGFNFHERDAIETDRTLSAPASVNRFDDSLGTSAAVPHGICSACRSTSAMVRPRKSSRANWAARRFVHPVLAVSGMGCGLCGSSRSRIAFNAWI